MKIAIIGNPGSGKSTLAIKLHKILNIPVYHLDAYFWKPGWQRVDRKIFEKKHQEICDTDEWIIDGIARRVFEYRVKRADVIIFLDMPTWLCLYRVFKRAFTYYGKVREFGVEDCIESFPSLEFLRFIINFNKNRKPIIEHILYRYKDQKKIFVIKNNTELNELIKKAELGQLNRITHTTADASHYDKESPSYDILNEENSKVINRTIATILKQHNVKSVLDMTCGTGSQVFYLAQKEYEVVGSDISETMLTIAQQKAKKENLDIQFINGDMRTLKVGTFDAVITIFNAIGHLTKSDFKKALHNIAHNLKNGGLYIFDIMNLNYWLEDNNIRDLTLDWQKKNGDKKVRKTQYSTINKEGILTSYTSYSNQVGDNKPEVSESIQTLQIYTAQQLKNILKKNSFEVIELCAIDGSPFIEDQSDRILVVAKKVN